MQGFPVRPEQVDVHGRRRYKALPQSFQARVDQKPECQIWIGHGIRRPELSSFILAESGRDTDQSRAVLSGPGNIAGRHQGPQTPVGFLQRIEEKGHITDMGEDSGYDGLQACLAVSRFYREVDVHTIAGLILHGFG